MRFAARLCHRLRNDFQLAVLSAMSVLSLILLMLFLIHRIRRGDWVFVAIDSLLVGALAGTLSYAWGSGNSRRASQILMCFNYIVGLVGTLLLGRDALPWTYPMLASNFVLISPHAAAMASVVFLTLLLVDGSAFPTMLIAMTYGVTALLVCFFAYAFAYRTETQRRQLEAMASKDALTGVHNRRAFQEELQRACHAFARDGTPCGLLILDLDHFKQVNDTWGHDAGDQVLVRLAEVVQRSVRKTDRFFRFGGEEFVLLVHRTDPEALTAMAWNLCRQVELGLSWEGKPVTISVGGALLESGETSDGWFVRADAALYRAKDQGRNRAVIDVQQGS